MPPRVSQLQNTLNLNSGGGGTEQEVTCPLSNQDGSSCRKRCMGEKRYRSMQEHIRRAHPEYYIAKLPATKESFELMITSPPHERPPVETNVGGASQNNHAIHTPSLHHPSHADLSGRSPVYNSGVGYGSSFEGYPGLGHHDGGYYTAGDAEAIAIYDSMQTQQRSSDEYRRGSLIPAASAAAALAQLHYHRPDPEWASNDMAQVILPSAEMSPTVTEADFLQNFYADQNHELKPSHFTVDHTMDGPPFMHNHPTFTPTTNVDQTSMLINALAAPTSPNATSTLSHLQRSFSRSYHNRPRKNSLNQQARLAKHERKRSREMMKRASGERGKMFSSDLNAAQLLGKRWEDLIDAATSATEEEDSRDLTPIPASPYQSPPVTVRTSLPPFAMGSQFQSFQASPLTRALTPPPGADSNSLELQPFPSVDSSLSSNLSHQHNSSADSTGSQFQIMNPNAMDNNSSPMFGGAPPVQIYCAGCRRSTVLKEAFACTNCISGLCGSCVEAIINGQSRGRLSMCPRCNGMDSTFKPFQLDLR